MGAADPSAGAAAADAGGKGGGGAGAGDPFSSMGGDPFSGGGMGIGDFGGLGGFGSTPSSPGGNIAETANVQGDPTGAVQAQQTMQAGAPTPGTPGGGIGGAQSNAGTPSGPAQLAQAQQPATFNQRYQGLPPTGQELTPQEPIDQNIPKTTGPGSGTPQQYGPEQPPASFSQRFGDASFAERFGNANPTLPSLAGAQLAQAGQNLPQPVTGTPNVDPTAQAGPGGAPGTPPAAAPAAAPAPTVAPGTATPDAGAGAAPAAGKTAAAPDTTDASSTGGQTDQTGQGAAGDQGQGGGGGGQGGFNPMQLIGALLRGGPMGALRELAREASGQGMMQPSLPGGGAPGRSGGPYGGQPEEPSATPPAGTPGEPGAPAAAAQTPEQQAEAAQQGYRAAAGQEAPGVAPTSTGFQEGQPGVPGTTANMEAPPAWAQQAAGRPDVNAAQSASLGQGTPSIGQDGTSTATNGMPGGTVPGNKAAPPDSQGGYGATQDQSGRPYHYKGTLTFNGHQYRIGSGGGQFASLPYGTYYLHPGAIGSVGHRIGAMAGIADNPNRGSNTVHDPLYRGSGGSHARAGVEVHPDVSGGRLRTNGCIAIDRSQVGQFRQDMRGMGNTPLRLRVMSDGRGGVNAVIDSANAPRPPGDIPGAGTVAERNNNPGNIKWGPDAQQAGATGTDRRGHAIFPSQQAGQQAQANLLRRRYNNMTVPQMQQHGYARDPHWARGVMAAGGFRPHERLNLNDPNTMSRLQRAIARQEGFRRPITATPSAQRVGEGSPIESFGAGSMGQGNIAQNWRRSSNVEDVNNPSFDQRFEGDMSREEAQVRKGGYQANLPNYQAPVSQLAQQLGLGDITIDQITQLLGQLQQAPPQ